jgi:hypothetical protein
MIPSCGLWVGGLVLVFAQVGCQVYSREDYDATIEPWPDVVEESEPPGLQRWSPGWEVLNEPYDASRSTVVVTQSGSTIVLGVTLAGTRPNQRHWYGATVFWSAPAMCLASLGQFSAAGCRTVTAQGITRVANIFEFGSLLADGTGAATANVTIGTAAMPVRPGTYQLEFHLRVDCPTGNTCPVMLQSPGPTFGTGSLAITVPP